MDREPRNRWLLLFIRETLGEKVAGRLAVVCLLAGLGLWGTCAKITHDTVSALTQQTNEAAREPDAREATAPAKVESS